MLVIVWSSTFNQRGLESNEQVDIWVLPLNFQAGHAWHFVESYYLDFFNVLCFYSFLASCPPDFFSKRLLPLSTYTLTSWSKQLKISLLNAMVNTLQSISRKGEMSIKRRLGDPHQWWFSRTCWTSLRSEKGIIESVLRQGSVADGLWRTLWFLKYFLSF